MKCMRRATLVLVVAGVVSMLFLAGCGGGGGGGGESDPPATSLSITLTKTTASPLTPLEIATSGLSAGASVRVVFSNSSGYSVTTSALRVNADASI
ncbi:MAG TPA: hypothetical protein VK997_12460, partial [Deferrisomatales bacterium]|nr:hypothetical protein [Deferrisomatales bacterium]